MKKLTKATKAKTPPVNPLMVALQDQLKNLAAQPLTTKSLTRLEHMARTAKGLLLQDNLGSAQVLPSNGLSFMQNPVYDDDMMPGVIATAPAAETFGSSAIRELIAVAKELMPKPASALVTSQPIHIEPSLMDRVMAISHAKEHGLADLADRLEAALIEKLPEKLPEGMKDQPAWKNGPPLANVMKVGRSNHQNGGIMKWFMPSWNGDLRLEPVAVDKDKTELRIFKPTVDEVRIVNVIGEACVAEGWLPTWTRFEVPADTSWTQAIVINAPLEKVGALAVPIMRPGPAVLTVVSFKDGRVETVDAAAPVDDTAYRGKLAEVAAKPDAVAAVTAKRPTPCCPQCIPGAILPAHEALLAFLSPAQHLTWAKDRTLVVEGGLSGATYLLAHRHSPVAQAVGRICYDLDASAVVHFHDWTIPPEEEVLAAKLILEHREDWLRNEATLWDRPDLLRFKNPFGDGGDGVADANFAEAFGMGLGAFR